MYALEGGRGASSLGMAEAIFTPLHARWELSLHRTEAVAAVPSGSPEDRSSCCGEVHVYCTDVFADLRANRNFCANAFPKDCAILTVGICVRR